MIHKRHDIGVAQQIGAYSDAVEVAPNARWLFTAGTPGLALDGNLPSDITGQGELAWTHIIAMLDKAGMTTRDLVKVTHYLVRSSDVPAYVAVRSQFLGDVRPPRPRPDRRCQSDMALLCTGPTSDLFDASDCRRLRCRKTFT